MQAAGSPQRGALSGGWGDGLVVASCASDGLLPLGCCVVGPSLQMAGPRPRRSSGWEPVGQPGGGCQLSLGVAAKRPAPQCCPEGAGSAQSPAATVPPFISFVFFFGGGVSKLQASVGNVFLRLELEY